MGKTISPETARSATDILPLELPGRGPLHAPQYTYPLIQPARIVGGLLE